MDKFISHIFGFKKVKMHDNVAYNYAEGDGGYVDGNNAYLPPHLQNVYLGDEALPEEPDFEYVPDPSLVSSLVGPHSTAGSCSIGQVGGTGQASALAQSMLLLEESVTSGAIIGQFEQLYRR